MNLFEEVGEDLFRPLTGINKRKYVDPFLAVNNPLGFFMQLSMYYAAWSAVEESHRKND